MDRAVFDKRMSEYILAIENRLNTFFSHGVSGTEKLKDAVLYSLLAGGKRIRPVLVLEFSRALGFNWENAIDTACAVELIHTYSLIHDDLPCMDNDDMRRGKPSCHKAFGEDVAVLAGDALLTHAFGMISDSAPHKISYESACRVISLFSRYSGIDGMIGGQILDISADGKDVDADELKKIELLKTSALIILSCKAGCIIANADEEKLKAAEVYGENLGLAFQVIDDVLDVEGDEKLLGKATGSDIKQDKSTYVDLLGIDEAKSYSRQLTNKAIESLYPIKDNEFLASLAEFLVSRNF